MSESSSWEEETPWLAGISLRDRLEAYDQLIRDPHPTEYMLLTMDLEWEEFMDWMAPLEPELKEALLEFLTLYDGWDYLMVDILRLLTAYDRHYAREPCGFNEDRRNVWWRPVSSKAIQWWFDVFVKVFGIRWKDFPRFDRIETIPRHTWEVMLEMALTRSERE